MIEIIILLSLLCVLALTVAWQQRPAGRGQIVGYRPITQRPLEHERGLELAGGHLPPDLGPPPPAATLEQHTNRIHVDS